MDCGNRKETGCLAFFSAPPPRQASSGRAGYATADRCWLLLAGPRSFTFIRLAGRDAVTA